MAGGRTFGTDMLQGVGEGAQVLLKDLCGCEKGAQSPSAARSAAESDQIDGSAWLT